MASFNPGAEKANRERDEQARQQLIDQRQNTFTPPQQKTTITNPTPSASTNQTINPITGGIIQGGGGGGGGGSSYQTPSQPQTTIYTPTPSAETLSGTTQQREQQIQTYQKQNNLNTQIQNQISSGGIQGYSGQLLTPQQVAKSELIYATEGKSQRANQYGEYYKGTTPQGISLLNQYNQSQPLSSQLPKAYEQVISLPGGGKTNYNQDYLKNNYQSLDSGMASDIVGGALSIPSKAFSIGLKFGDVGGTILRNQFENSPAVKIINSIPGQKFLSQYTQEEINKRPILKGQQYLISKGVPIPQSASQDVLFIGGGLAGAEFAVTSLGSKFFSSIGGKLFTTGFVFNNAITGTIENADKTFLYQPTSIPGRFGKAVGQGAVIGQSSLLAGAYAGQLTKSLITNPSETVSSVVTNYPETLGFIVGGGLKVGFDKESFIKSQKNLLADKRASTLSGFKDLGISVSYDVPFKKSFNKILTPLSPNYKPVEVNALGEKTIRNVKSSTNEEVSLFNDKSTRVNNNVPNTFDIGLIPERGAELKFDSSLINSKDAIPRSNPTLNPQNRFESVVLDITKQNNDVVGGSYAGNILFEGAREPGDVDIISKNPLKSANMIKDVLGEGTQVNPHQVNGIDVVAVKDIFGNKADIVSRKGYSSSRSFLGFGDLRTTNVEGVRVLNPTDLLKKKIDVLKDQGLHGKKSDKAITDIQTYTKGNLNPDLNKATISGAYGNTNADLMNLVGKKVNVAHSSTGFFSLFKNEKELAQTPEQLKASGGYKKFFGTPGEPGGMTLTRVTRLGMEAGFKDLFSGEVTFKKGGNKPQILIEENQLIGLNTNKESYGNQWNILHKSSEREVGLDIEQSPGVANVIVKKQKAGVTLINGNKVDILLVERKMESLDLVNSKNSNLNNNINTQSSNVLSSGTLDLLSKANKNELSNSQMNELSTRLTKETGVSYSRENKPYFSLNKLYSGIASLSPKSKSNKVSIVSPSKSSMSSMSISRSISSFSNPSSSVSKVSSSSSYSSPKSYQSSYISTSSTLSSYSKPSSYSRSISSSSRGSSRGSSFSYPSYPKTPTRENPILPYNPFGKRKKLKRLKGISQPIAYTPSLGSSVFNIKLSNKGQLKSGKVSVFQRRGTLGIKELRKINQGSSIF